LNTWLLLEVVEVVEQVVVVVLGGLELVQVTL
jgi:hypothetical protein